MFTFILIFLNLAVANPLTNADEFANIYHPVFEIPSHTESSVEPDPEPDWSKDLLDQYAEVRIKIFPHNNKYNAPQGKDTVIDKVTITSVGSCKMFQADNPTSVGGITRTKLLKTGNSFELTTKNISAPIWIECVDAIQVTRPDYIKTPIRYTGVIFAKLVQPAIGEDYITLVNVISFQDYLKGVVPSEMPASWSAEALKAQAIAARTYALYELTTKVYLTDLNIVAEGSGAQMDDTVTYQAYLGLKNTTAATDKAVNETIGQAMIHQGKVVKAYFHADSGGYTENAENVWGKYYPYIIARPEVYPSGSIPGSEWTYTAPLQEVHDKLVAKNFIAESDSVLGVRIDKNDYYPSTRPKFVTLILDNYLEKKILAVDFSFAMRIRSAWFNLTSTSSLNESSPTAATSLKISGKGFGHGAGMNQWGARVMVDKLNKTATEVLKFYYTGIEITD